jgi:hypothetical protein
MAGDVVDARPSGAAALGLAGRRLDGVVAVLSALLIAGVAWDFQRHAEGISFAEEGFLTVQHAFFYSMFLAIAAVIGAATVANRRAGARWLDAVPPGYGWGVVGVLIFGFGGVGDVLWHSAFGFEQGLEGLVSPSHLALALGATVFLASPLRAAWYREGGPEGLETLSVVLSASLVFTLLSLFGAFVNPLPEPVATVGPPTGTVWAVATLVVYPLLFVGGGLVLLQRFDLPPGALTVAFAIPALASAVPFGRGGYAAAALAAGLVADAVASWRRPRREETVAVRLFGLLVPLAFTGAFLALVELDAGVVWTTHVWAGAVALAGLAGVLLTYAVAPPATPGEAREPPGSRDGERPGERAE